MEATFAVEIAKAEYHQSYIIIMEDMSTREKKRMMKLAELMGRAKTRARVRKLRHVQKEIGLNQREIDEG